MQPSEPGPLPVVIEPPLNGRIESAPEALRCGGPGGAACGAEFSKRSGALLIAIPDEGHRFREWTGGCAGTEIDALGYGRFYINPAQVPEGQALRCGARFEAKEAPALSVQTSYEPGAPLDPMSPFVIQLMPPELRYEWSQGPLADETPLGVQGPRLEGFIVSGQLQLRVRAFLGEVLVDQRELLIMALGSAEPPLWLEQDAHLLSPGAPLTLIAKALDLSRPEAGYLDVQEVYALEQLDWFVVPAEGLSGPLLALERPIDPQAMAGVASFEHRFEQPGIYWVHLRAKLVSGGYALGSASVQVE